jgi:predicted rRNA methylase YqxC with S4 and FtsJ domains
VKDPAVHEAVIARVTESAASCGLARIAMTPSPITGATGNQEFLFHLRSSGG